MWYYEEWPQHDSSPCSRPVTGAEGTLPNILVTPCTAAVMVWRGEVELRRVVKVEVESGGEGGGGEWR